MWLIWKSCYGLAVTRAWYRAVRSSSVALHLLSKSSSKIFGVKEWSVWNLRASKALLFPHRLFSNTWIKPFPSEKVMITTQMCFYPPFSPWRKEICKPQTEHQEREGMTLKRAERQRQRYSGITQNRSSACEQICPRGKRQLTNYLWAKWLPFGLGYQLCR